MNFKTKLRNINSWNIVHLPIEVSKQLPSRGMVMLEGAINGNKFQSGTEPDGKGSHWFKVEVPGLKAGDEVEVEIEVSKQWPEPKIPEDLQTALSETPDVKLLWDDITVMARWDWLRWINGTKEEATRKRRIEVAFSKLRGGERRPCCFNRNMCMEPHVSQSGVLITPA